MKRTVRMFMPQRRSHYVTKPLLTMAAFIGFFLLVDFMAYGAFSFNGPKDILVIIIAQVPFMALGFALVMYLESTQHKLSNLAMTDGLTGLPNRRKFMYSTQQALDRSIPGYLLILDADHFKRINDTYGHAVGDLCLEAISARLSALQEPHDLIGRIGGEEFGAFLPDRAQNDILEMGRRMTHQFTVDAPQLSKPLHFTMSIGAAEANGADTLIGLMRRADEALYEAKTTGRAKLVVWHKAVGEAQARRAS